MNLDPLEPWSRLNMPLDLPGTRRTSVAALRWIAAALLLLATTSITDADFDAGVRAYNRGDYASAFREFRALAEQGDAKAQNNLGFMYANGKGVSEDDRLAIFWYHKAAEQGNAGSQFNLGVMYDEGKGVSEDDRLAAFWHRKAAEQGNAGSQFYLGVMYNNGEGVPEDDVRAYAWVDLAAAQGDEDAEQFRAELREGMTPAQIAEGQALSRRLAAQIESDSRGAEAR